MWSLYVFVNGFLTIGLLALLAVLSRNPFVFPSLGPTAYLLFLSPARGELQSAKHDPRPCDRSHLRLCRIRYDWRRDHALWSACRDLLAKNSRRRAFALGHGRVHGSSRASHPPAGATTLIVSLGIISKPSELVIIEVAVFLLVAQALVINRLAGLPYPIWNAAASIDPANEDRN